MYYVYVPVYPDRSLVILMPNDHALSLTYYIKPVCFAYDVIIVTILSASDKNRINTIGMGE